MKERIGVVLSDIDGTQIIHGQSLPTHGVQMAARQLRANNIPLLEVTGRSHALLRKLVVPLDLQNNLCSLDGGATIAHADSGEVVWSRWLSGERAASVIDNIGRLCTNIHYDLESRRKNPRQVLARIRSGEDQIQTTPSVFAIFKKQNQERILGGLADMQGIQHTPIMGYEDSTELRCIQVVAAGVDKQQGVKQLRDYASAHTTPALAIGDGTNDLRLFAATQPGDVKVAMGNAAEELKDMADWVAPPVEADGFVAALVHFGLID